MLFKNHFFSLVLIGIACASTQVHASQFTSLSKCREHFQTSVQSGSRDIAAMDAWCKGQMSELDFCTESALLSAMMTNSYKAADIPIVRAPMELWCRRDIEARASGSNTVTGTLYASSTSAGAAFDANGVPQPPARPANANCASVAADQQRDCQAKLQNYQAQLQTYQRNLQAYNQRQEQARQQQLAAQQVQDQQQRANNLQATQMMVGAIGGAFANANRSTSSASSLPQGFREVVTTVRRPDGSVTEVRRIETSPGATPYQGEALARANSPTATAQDISQATIDRQALQADLRGEKNLTPQQIEQLNRSGEEAIRGAQAADPKNPGQAPAPKTNVAAEAEQARTKLLGELDTSKTQLAPAQSTELLQQTVASIKTIQENIRTFVTEKDKCASLADRANALCLEGTSPGIKTAKAVVDNAGPILPMIGSAFKACSSTRKVMNIAATAMTAAKGICVATKVMCDASCGKTFAAIKKYDEELKLVRGKLNAEYAAGQSVCAAKAAAAAVIACTTKLNSDKAAIEAAMLTIGKITLDETSINSGTTPAMIASCEEKSKDIMGLTMNILSMTMAKMSAQKCEKQLSTAGAGAGGGTPQNVSTAEYCASPENKTSDFCRCQGDQTAEGCAGALAGGGPGGNLTDDKKGISLNLQKGPNGFAGGTGGGKPGSSGVTVGAGGGTGAAIGAAQLKSGNGISYANPNYGGGSNGGVAGGGSAGGDAASAAAPAAEDKKWSFGSLASSGSGSGSGGRGFGTGDGSMSAEQQEAIERKIASDRYAAEVTTSTGPNNFDKIKQAVRLIGDTLEPNQ